MNLRFHHLLWLYWIATSGYKNINTFLLHPKSNRELQSRCEVLYHWLALKWSTLYQVLELQKAASDEHTFRAVRNSTRNLCKIRHTNWFLGQINIKTADVQQHIEATQITEHAFILHGRSLDAETSFATYQISLIQTHKRRSRFKYRCQNRRREPEARTSGAMLNW